MVARLIVLSPIALTLLEIALFVLIGQAIGVLPTLLGVILMAALGIAILRRQGLALLRQLQGSFREGRLPARSIGDGMLLSLAGALLIVPGYFTGLIGLLLLLPVVRSAIYWGIGRRFSVVDLTPRQAAPDQPEVIELGRDHFRPG